MKFTPLTKKIVQIVGILAGALLLVLLAVYLIFGRKPKAEHTAAGAEDFADMSLNAFKKDDPVLNGELMKEYDFTVLEIWYPESADCISYIGEMNMFAEECLHRDDEMYAYVTGICIHLNDASGRPDPERLSVAREAVEQEVPIFPQYIADVKTEKALKSLNVKEYPTVIFLNRQGRVLDMVTGQSGSELCETLDGLVDEYMKEKRKAEREGK